MAQWIAHLTSNQGVVGSSPITVDTDHRAPRGGGLCPLLCRGCLCSALADFTVRDKPACCFVLITIHSTQHSPVVCCLGSYSIASYPY